MHKKVYLYILEMFRLGMVLLVDKIIFSTQVLQWSNDFPDYYTII